MREETAVLRQYPGTSQQITSYYNENAVERGWSCDVVQMGDITRAKVIRESSSQLVLGFQYFFTSEQAGARQGQGCEGFGSRVATFDKGPGGLSLVSMTGEARNENP
jgi:hypothetical protein